MAAPKRMVGHDRILKALQDMPQAAALAAVKVLDGGAADMVRTAKGFAPRDEGNLVESIREDPGEHPLQRVVEAGGPLTEAEFGVRAASGVAYDYAIAQEFGTEKMTANPFFWPAYRFMKKPMLNRMMRAWRKALREAWGGNGTVK